MDAWCERATQRRREARHAADRREAREKMPPGLHDELSGGADLPLSRISPRNLSINRGSVAIRNGHTHACRDASSDVGHLGTCTRG